MLEIKKIPSLAIVKSVVRNNLHKPLSKGSVYAFISPNMDTMYKTVKKYTAKSELTRFSIFSVRGAYHPNNMYFFMNSTCKRRLVNYRKIFMGDVKVNLPNLKIIKCDAEQLSGMNVVDFSSAIPAEVAKDYIRENKPELLWVYILKEFRKTFRIPTKYPNPKEDPGLKPFSEDNSYPDAYMVFDLDKFDIPKVSELNVQRSAKYPDVLRNFLYFMEYNTQYSYLLSGINFLFVSSVGTIKLKVNDSMEIIESAMDDMVFSMEDYKRYNVSRYDGSVVTDIMEAATPAVQTITPEMMHTLVVLLNKMVQKPGEIDVELEDKVKEINPVVIQSTPETEAQDIELNKVLRIADNAVENMNTDTVNELSQNLMDLDKASGEPVQTQAVKAILDAVEVSRQERVTRMSTPKQQLAINKMYNSTLTMTGDKNKEDKVMDLLTNPTDMGIPKVNIPVHSEQGYDENGFMKFTEAYNEKLLVPHIVQAASAFKDASVPVYVDKIDITDTSDKFNEVNTVSTRFIDEDGNKFTVTVDLPKMYKGNRIKLGSSEKCLIGQLTYLPILKVGDDVIITTNHNKIFMEKKYGNGLTPQGNKMLRALDKMIEVKEIEDFDIGDYSAPNTRSSWIPDEMRELSTKLGAIDKRTDKTINGELPDGEIFVSFKSSLIETMTKESKDTHPEFFVVGYAGKEPILVHRDTSRMFVSGHDINGDTIYTGILKLSDSYKMGIRAYYDQIKTVNKLTSTYIKLMNEWVPLIFVLMYTDGLHTILGRTNTTYEVISSEDAQRRVDKDKEIKIQLKDATLYINVEDVKTSLLYFPLTTQDLSMYTLAELESIEGTADVLTTVAGGNLSFPLNMSVYKDCFIDPYTKTILESLNQPTEFTGVMLYANELLASPESMEELSLTSCRIRYAEMIQAIYYKELSNAYAEYAIKKRRGSKNAKMSIAKNRVCQAVMEIPNNEEYSKINPYMESIKRWSCNYKGHMGKNLPRSYTWESRSYHPTYVGSIGLPTAFSANIGINKQLTIDPMIDNLSGMFKIAEDVNTLKSKQIITSTEAITTGSASRSDAPRTAMNQSQKSAIIAINKMDTAYFTNSFDAVLPYMSEDFVEKATDVGVVTKITPRYVQVKYKDGSVSSIKLKRIYKNSAKGKYVTCHMNPAVKVGQKVTADTILAHDMNFFKNTPTGLVATMGAMVNVLWKTESLNFEDSIIISESAAKMFMVKAVKRVSAKVAKNTKILSYLSLDDYTNAETELVTYIKGSDDAMLSNFLDNATLTELDKKSKTAHKSGIIVNINLTYAFDPATASKSIQDMISKIKKDVLSVQEEAVLIESTDSFQKREHTDLPQEVTAPHKLNGDTIEKDELLIEYFIEYYDFTGRGDKGSQTTALKGIVAQVRPDHLMPIGVLSGRRYDVISSQYSPGARKTFDVNMDMLANAFMAKETDDARALFGVEIKQYDE